jgi:hypothetical protein
MNKYGASNSGFVGISYARIGIAYIICVVALEGRETNDCGNRGITEVYIISIHGLTFGTSSAAALESRCASGRLRKVVGTQLRVYMVLLLVGTLIISAITGAAVSSGGRFFLGLTGQVLHGLLSIVCFTLVGVAFWRFGWEVGVIDLALLFIAGNVASSFCGHLTKD